MPKWQKVKKLRKFRALLCIGGPLLNCRRLSKLENDQLTDEQKRIMDDFDRTIQRKNWLYERKVAGVGTSVHLETRLVCDSPPGKVGPSRTATEKMQKLQGDSLLCEDER